MTCAPLMQASNEHNHRILDDAIIFSVWQVAHCKFLYYKLKCRIGTLPESPRDDVIVTEGKAGKGAKHLNA